MFSDGLNACINQGCLAMVGPFRAESFRKSNSVPTVLGEFHRIWVQLSTENMDSDQ